MDDSKQRKIGAILSYTYIVISSLIHLIYTPFLISNLGQSEYGLYSLVRNIISYLTIMDFGFSNAIIVYTAKYQAKNKVKEEQKLHSMFNLVFKIIAVVAAILGVILFLCTDYIFCKTMTSIELHKLKVMMLILSFNLFISFYFAIYNSIILAYEKFIFQKSLIIVNSILTPLLMIPVLFLGYKSIALCIVSTIVNFLILFTSCLYCKRKIKVNLKYTGFDKKIFKVVLGYSVWLFINMIVDKINWNVDNFLLGYFSGTIAVSVYAIALTFNELFKRVSTVISDIFLPKISKMVAKKATPKDLTNEMIKVGRLQFYIMLLMCSSLIIFGKEFIIFWVGTKYEISYYIALILLIPLSIASLEHIGLSILQALNKYKFYMIISLITSVLNVLISIILVQKYEAIGAAIGTGLSLIICHTIIINIYYYCIIKLDVIALWKIFITQLLKLSPTIILIIYIKTLMPLTNIYWLTLVGIIYLIIYGLYSYFIAFNTYEKELVSKITNKILKRG